MTSDRPYRKGPGHTWALDQLKRYAGKQFDPELVAVFEGVSLQLPPALREREMGSGGNDRKA
jgi:HD-GYP domain-containing protein (c-di-GMP phosphodiesterase class II)